MFHIAGLSLRDVSEKYHVTMASKESVMGFPTTFMTPKEIREIWAC